MIRMLKLSPYCYPEQLSSSHLSKDLSESFAKEDIQSIIYAPTPTRGISKETRAKYKKIPYEELRNGTTIIHRFSMFGERRNLLLRAIRYLLVQVKQLHYGVKENNIDLIYSASTPPTQGVLCGIVKKRLSSKYGYNIPYLYCLHDVFPDSLVNEKKTKQGSLIWKIGRIIENYTYHSADKIIVISNDIKNNIMQKGVPEEKIVVIPNWIDTKTVRPVSQEKNGLFDEFNIPKDCFIVTYAGNLGQAQSISTILDAAELIVDIPYIQFVIFGGGSGREEVEKRVKKLPNVRLFPLMPQERVSEVYSLGSVSIVACKKGFGQGAIPSKTFSIMATRTPVILSFDKGSELWNLIKKNDCGFLCEAEDAVELSKTIVEASKNPELVDVKGRNALSLTEREFSKERGTSSYISVIKELVKEKRT